MLPYVCCSHGLVGTGLPTVFLLKFVFLSPVETSLVCAVPEASTTSLVLPAEVGLKGAGPEEGPARSHGFLGGLLPNIMDNTINRWAPKENLHMEYNNTTYQNCCLKSKTYGTY